MRAEEPVHVPDVDRVVGRRGAGPWPTRPTPRRQVLCRGPRRCRARCRAPRAAVEGRLVVPVPERLRALHRPGVVVVHPEQVDRVVAGVEAQRVDGQLAALGHRPLDLEAGCHRLQRRRLVPEAADPVGNLVGAVDAPGVHDRADVRLDAEAHHRLAGAVQHHEPAELAVVGVERAHGAGGELPFRRAGHHRQADDRLRGPAGEVLEGLALEVGGHPVPVLVRHVEDEHVERAVAPGGKGHAGAGSAGAPLQARDDLGGEGRRCDPSWQERGDQGEQQAGGEGRACSNAGRGAVHPVVPKLLSGAHLRPAAVGWAAPNLVLL